MFLSLSFVSLVFTIVDVVSLQYCSLCWMCVDINECSEGVSGCEQNCTNTPGQYSCFCMGGYTLDDNEHTCTGE